MFSWYVAWLKALWWESPVDIHTSYPQISEEKYRLERRVDLILSGENCGEGGRLIHSKVYNLVTYRCACPCATQMKGRVSIKPRPVPDLGALVEGLVALMVGMALSQILPWPQCFPVAHDVFGLYSNIPKR